MVDLNNAISLVAANPGRGFFSGPRDATLVSKAEVALGGQLPPTYRKFVSQLGAGNFGSFEIYGIIDENFETSSIPNGVWLTLSEYKEGIIPNNFVVIGSTGDGDYYCIELQDGKESPVIIYQPGLPPHRQKLEKVAEDFGDFFLNHVRNQL